MWNRLAFAVTVFAIAAGIAYGQNAVTVIGVINPGDCAAFNSPTVIKDAGVNCASGGGGQGTVTSVALSLPNLLFSVQGSPVVNNGTLTGVLIGQLVNTAFMGPLSGPPPGGPPSFRAISGADLPLPSALTIGGVRAAGPTTSQYVFALTTTGGTLLKQPQFAELSGSALPGQLPIATSQSFGAIETLSPLGSNWITGWVNGIAQQSQPQFSDIAGAIANGQLPQSGNNTVLSNISGGTSNPQPNALSAVLDAAFGAAQGSLLYRGPAAWTVLIPGINGQVLTTSGASNNPLWTTVTGTGTMTGIFAAPSIFLSSVCNSSCVVSVASSANNTVLANTSGISQPPVPTSPSSILDIFGSAEGNILTRGATVWAALTAGSSGSGTTQQFLKTNGAGSTPSWATVALTNATSSTVVNISLSTSVYIDGPTLTQGTNGVWQVAGGVTILQGTADSVSCKLWDGTTVIDSLQQTIPTGLDAKVSLSGILANPAGNIRISCKNQTNAGTMQFNASGNSHDSTVSAVRIQ